MRMSVNLSERQVRKNRTRHERQKSWRLLPRFALRECLSLRGSSVEDNVLMSRFPRLQLPSSTFPHRVFRQNDGLALPCGQPALFAARTKPVVLALRVTIGSVSKMSGIF